MGYNKNKRSKREGRFVMLDSEMLQGEHWQRLSTFAQCIYILLKINYRPYSKNKVQLKYEEAEKYMGRETVTRAFKELITKGWVKKTKVGGLYRYYCEYRLTGKYDPDVV